MALATPVDREFKTLRAGFIRDQVVLANFREGLRALVNPETGALFTEEEIARATRPGSRWYIEAQALDDLAQLEQRNALYLADQIQLDRATGKWLTDFHGAPRGQTYLEATGGSGSVDVQGTAGTIVLGSTTLPDDFAYKARDPAGNVYQVFGTYTVGANGHVTVRMVALGTGAATNPPVDTVLTWTQRDPNMIATAKVLAGFASGFTGGTDRETDAELASRLAGLIEFRPGPGNDAQYRAWARESTNAVEDGFVYPCALNNGSVIVAITQKRAGALGPLARIPNPDTLATAIAYLTPPTSPVAPPRSFVVVTPAVSEPSDVVLELALPRASSSGWQDPQPFPSGPPLGLAAAYISSVTDQQHFQISCADLTLPGQVSGATLTGANVPHLMVWDKSKSQFCEVLVTSIHDLTGGNYAVTCTGTVPAMTLAAGAGPDDFQFVSPKTVTGYMQIIADAASAYFDQLGPGELFDATLDSRGARCRRFPTTSEEFAPKTTAVLATDVTEALGGIEVNLASVSQAAPSFPSSIALGPHMLTLRNLAVYEL